MRNYSRWLLRLIGPVLLIYFLTRPSSGLADIAAILSQLDLLPLMVSLLLYPAFVAVKSWRWNLIMRELNIEAPPLGRSMILYMIGLFLGGTTPGQSGDFIKGWYMRERGQPLGPVLFSIVLDRLFDFVIMAVLALLGLVAFLDAFPPNTRQPIVLLTIAAAVALLVATPLLMARGPRTWFLVRVAPLLPTRARAPVERLSEQFSTLSLRPALLVQLLLASAGSALFTMVRIYLLFLALRLVNVPPLAVASSTALIAILQALPITISGVGVREAILIPVLGLYGYAQALAISLSALFLLVNIEHILIGFLVSLRYPLGRVPAGALNQPEAPEQTRL